MSTRIRGATVVTMDRHRSVLVDADVVVERDRIAAVGSAIPEGACEREVDGRGRVLIPGFVQTHVHLCQTLFRGMADDLELLDWLKLRIWPLEGAHDPDSLYWSAMLGAAELLRGGTTTVLDMETVHHTRFALEAILESGIRAVAGKCMMDHGDGVPATLMERTDASLQESVDLLEAWHMKGDGRIRYAFCPRFVVSCTDRLLGEVRALSERYGVHVHTHAAENRGEVELVLAERGRRNLEHMAELGLVGRRLVVAHAIWAEEGELDLVRQSDTALSHCPSSNLKLASGIADTPGWLRRGIRFGLGADGAPCNNTLDMFTEMRLAALLPKPRRGPTTMAAPLAFELATLGGARALGMDDEIGSLEVGKKADMVLLDWSRPHHLPRASADVYSQLVYQSRAEDVVMTMVDGRILYDEGVLRSVDEALLRENCEAAAARVVERSGVSLGRIG